MRGCLIVVWACAACSFTPGRFVADGDAGPIDGMLIDAEPGDGDDNDDGDGDGHPNASDNCPATANTDQHDEDADGTGDACDPCPQLDADTDTDGDGIGDACDPRPTIAGDILAHFHSFADGSGLPTNWTVIAGASANWTVANDALVNSSVEATKQVTFNLGARPHSLDIGIEVTQTSGTASDTTGVGATIEGNGTTNNFFMCFVQTVTTQQFTQLSGPGTTTLASSPMTPSFPGRYRIATLYDGATLRCRFAGPGAPADLVTTQTPLGFTQVGIRMRNTAVRVEYIAIYRSP